MLEDKDNEVGDEADKINGALTLPGLFKPSKRVLDFTLKSLEAIKGKFKFKESKCSSLTTACFVLRSQKGTEPWPVSPLSLEIKNWDGGWDREQTRAPD